MTPPQTPAERFAELEAKVSAFCRALTARGMTPADALELTSLILYSDVRELQTLARRPVVPMAS